MGANVLIMAGGTGGHVFPALACAREFQNRGYTVHWLGTPRGIENELVPNAGLPLHLINVTGLRGKSKLSLLKAPFVLLKAVMQARKIIRELKPVCVLGFGGYVTGPGGVAAKLAGVPVIVHEQNAVAGTANRLLVPLAARVCEAFPKTFAASDKLRTTGNPVRTELFMAIARDALAGRKAHLLSSFGTSDLVRQSSTFSPFRLYILASSSISFLSGFCRSSHVKPSMTIFSIFCVWSNFSMFFLPTLSLFAMNPPFKPKCTQIHQI